MQKRRSRHTIKQCPDSLHGNYYIIPGAHKEKEHSTTHIHNGIIQNQTPPTCVSEASILGNFGELYNNLTSRIAITADIAEGTLAL